MRTWTSITVICIFALGSMAIAGSDNKDPDKFEPVMAPGCGCPLVKGYSKQYCKAELEEMNKIAKMPTVQTNCVDNFVYTCPAYGKTAWIAEKCVKKSKCGKAGLALVGKYQNFTINSSDRRICLTEAGMRLLLTLSLDNRMKIIGCVLSICGILLADQSMSEPLPTNLAVEYGVKPVNH